MPTLSCPSCGRLTPKLLAESSKDAVANYYRCEACGHIWTVNKRDPARIHHVTPLTKKPPTDE